MSQPMTLTVCFDPFDGVEVTAHIKSALERLPERLLDVGLGFVDTFLNEPGRFVCRERDASEVVSLLKTAPQPAHSRDSGLASSVLKD